MLEQTLRIKLAQTARQTVSEGLNRGASGNVSARFGSGFLITPSGRPATELTPEQMVYVDMQGNSQDALPPSSEWRIHRDLYIAHATAEAIVHVHSPFAVSLACLRKGIPAFNYMIAVAGGKDIRCADYATFGTQALSDNILIAMRDRRACLMANHGQVAIGKNLDHALSLSIEVEALCEQFWRASLMGPPVLLSNAEMDEVIEKFKGYGAHRD